MWYQFAFAIARTLAIKATNDTTMHRDHPSRDPVQSLGSPQQQSTQVRGPRWSLSPAIRTALNRIRRESLAGRA
jgi:hypothetical protein